MTYADLVRDHIADIAARNADALDSAADLVLSTVRSDGLVLTAGAGHSLAAVAETFFRAGGLACVRPLVREDIHVFGGAVRATAAERRSGLAAEVFGEISLSGNDVLVVFSNSGVNPYPVELAESALSAGCPVIAVTSPGAAGVRRAGTVLTQHATIVLDTRTRPGDVAHPSGDPVTASLSTLSSVYLWNEILARLDGKAAEAGVPLPRWRSSNVPGGDEANAALLDRYRGRVRELG